MPQTTSLAARAGRWSAHHRKTAILGWLAFVIVAVVIGGATGVRTLEDADRGVGESGRADRVLDAAFPSEVVEERVLVQGRAGQTVRDPQFRAAVRDTVAAVRTLEGARAVASPLEREHAGQVSRDGRSALVTYELPDTEQRPADEQAQAVHAALARVGDRHPQLRVEPFGDATVDAALSKRFEDDFQRAETLSIPITLAILVLAFGALVAAGLPVLLGLSAVAASLGLVALPSQILPVDEAISSVILLIGMAVGVDYSLFYLREEREEREERAAGRSPRDAIEIAAATSGRAVLVSGLTVMIAMAGMFLTGDATFMSFAVGTIIVVAVAMIGSLTVVPATLAALGHRVEKGRVPFLHRLRRADGGSRVWNALLDRVLRRPALSAAASAAVLVVMALPALGLNTALGGVDTLPRDIPVVQTYDRIQQAFPGGTMPAVVAVEAEDVTAAPVVGAIRELGRRASATGLLYEPVSVTVSDDHRVASVQIPMAADGADERSTRALEALREDLIPATLGAVGGVRASVTGMAAGTEDFNAAMAASAPIVFAFVLTLEAGGLGTRHLARAVDERSGGRVEDLAPDPEGQRSLGDVEPLVLAVVDVER